MSKATAQEVVNMMAELMAEGDEAFRRMHGEAALDIAREVQAALMAQFESNLGHVVLWEQFLRTPQEVGAAVSVVVAYCMKRDQVLADWLDRTLLRYQGEGGGEEQVDQARVETQSESRSRQETSDV